MSKRIAVILSPWAGRGNGGKKRLEMERALHGAGVKYDLKATRPPGDGMALALAAVEAGYEVVTAAGGDGTINQVINGLKAAEAQAGRRALLGVIPLGTGLDLLKSFPGFTPHDLPGAARRLAAGSPRCIDTGRAYVDGAGPFYFQNNLGMGLDAQVAAEAQAITRLKGNAVYFLALWRGLRRYRAGAMTVRYNRNEARGRMMFASISNGPSLAGRFRLAPSARIDDGLLDLCLVDRLRFDQVVCYVPLVIKGWHTRLKVVTLDQVRGATIESQAGMPVDADGEVLSLSAQSVSVEVAPGSIDLLV